MFHFFGEKQIENLQKQIENIGKMLDREIDKKKINRLNNEFEHLSHELRKLKHQREWFERRNLSAVQTVMKTKRQIKSENHLRKFVSLTPKNKKTRKIEGISLVAKHIADGNAEEANRALGKFIFNEEIKPNIDILVAGIEKELITFVAEDIW